MTNITPFQPATMLTGILYMAIDADDAQIPDNQDGDLTKEEEQDDEDDDDEAA
jgi:hypothetical protein